MSATTTPATVTAANLFTEWTDWEGESPIILANMPLDRVADEVMDYLAAQVPSLADYLPFVSVDLIALQQLAREELSRMVADAARFAALRPAPSRHLVAELRATGSVA